jgi:primary-amine oxidase
MYDEHAKRVTEARVSLKLRRVLSWRNVPLVFPPFIPLEAGQVDQPIKSDARFRAALARRGIDDVNKVMIDLWPDSSFAQGTIRRRTCRGLCWLWEGPGDNGYARPIEGLVVVFDLDELGVVDVIDSDASPIPDRAARYGAEEAMPTRLPIRPLEIIQRDGPGFTIDGYKLDWANWELRIGFDAREGLILHGVGFYDGDRFRRLVHRASVSEILTSYGDPDEMHNWKSLLDVGEVGIGLCANSLRIGCDCLGEIRYLDAVVVDNGGNPLTISRAICIHEEDFGILWKHFDGRSGSAEVRRSRRLVVSWIATVANYDYAFYWYFYLDGTIEFQVKLTGIVHTTAGRDEGAKSFKTSLGGGLFAPVHQHFFNLRLDLDIDGPDNEISEVHAESVPRRLNPAGSGFGVKKSRLAREADAKQRIDPARGRYWLVENPGSRNKLGDPVAYKLIPGDNVTSMALPDSKVIKRAGFVQNHLWVTPFNAKERYAAGDYPYGDRGGGGLPVWVKRNRSIRRKDIVVWYSIGATHVVRLEDWPVMPVTCMGFMLRPAGFFDRNPALDVPPSANACHCLSSVV